MRKKFIGIFSLILIACISCIPLTTIEVTASTSFTTNAIYPLTGYGTLIEITDIAYDDENDVIYILQRQFADKSAAIYRCESDGNSYELSATLTDPQYIYFTDGELYVYDSGNIVAINSNETYAINETTIQDFVVVNNLIYALTGNKIISIDMTSTQNKQDVLTNIARATTLSHSDGNLYFIEEISTVPYSAVKKYSIALGTTSKIAFNGTISAKNIAVNQRYIIIASAENIQIIDLATSENLASLAINSSNPNMGGYIKAVQCMLITNSNTIYIGDNLSKCIQGFKYNEIEKQIDYNDFYMGSFGSGDGQFYNPTDMFEQNGKKYILDSGNDRVQIIDDENNVNKIDLPKQKNYSKIIVDSNDTIYIANQNEIYDATNKNTISGYSSITDLQLSFNSDVYFSSSRNIYQIKNDKQILILEANSNISSFSFDLKNENIFYTTQNKIIKHNILSPNDNIEYAVSNVIDMDIDFMSNIYLLLNDNTIKTLNQTFTDDNSYQISSILLRNNSTIAVSSISSLAIDKTSGEIMLCHKDEHLISKLPFDTLRAITEGDVPKLLPTVNILDNTHLQNPSKIGVIDGWPSTIVYPFHDMYKHSAIYPNEHAYSKVTRLYGNTPTVIIIEEIDNYYYVIYERQAGFILKNKVRILDDGNPPFEQAMVLHTNTVVYKLPLSQKDSNSKTIFQCDLLDKGTEIKIIDIVSNYKDINGFVWYKIEYENKIGYISRDNVTRKQPFSENQIRNGKIRAEISEGKVDVFDTTNAGALAIASIKDGVSVKILEILPNDWLYIEGEDITGKIITGYVKKQYVTYQMLTTAQIVGICMISATVVLVIAALILFKIHKSKKRKTF